MNMTQKFLASLAVAASAMIGSADTLYWQVAGLEAGDTFDSATLYARNGNTSELTQLGTTATIDNGLLANDGDGTYSPDVMRVDNIETYSGSNPAYTFFVEMANYSAGGTGTPATKQGYAYTYSELVSAGYIATNPFDSSSATAAAAAGNMGAPTPEPTSGMLLLIGGSLLALRRRRRQA